MIVDVAEDSAHRLPVERVFHYEHPAVGGRNVLLVPFAGGWRADLQCNEDDDPDAFSDPEGARAWVRSTLRLIGSVLNSSASDKPSGRMPVPASSTINSPSARISTHEVLPP